MDALTLLLCGLVGGPQSSITAVETSRTLWGSQLFQDPTQPQPPPEPQPPQGQPQPQPQPQTQPQPQPQPEPQPEPDPGTDAGGSAEFSAGAQTSEPGAAGTLETTGQEPAAEPAPAEEAGSEGKWYDKIDIGAFVDAYASINFQFPIQQNDINTFRAYDQNNGFSVAWAGLNVAYEGEQFGGVIDLRLGPASLNYHSAVDVTYKLHFVKQMYATWKPKIAKGKLAFDLGKFDTLYGAEVAESYNDMNYTRGFLNFMFQPFYHTGFRMRYQPIDLLAVNFMAVNGWNNSIDNNPGKTFGIQFAITPSDKFGAYLGYLTGPEQDRGCRPDWALGGGHPCVESPGDPPTEVEGANKRWRHFADLVLGINPIDKLSMLVNGDFGYDEALDELNGVPMAQPGDYTKKMWYGAMFSIRYAFTEKWALAGRGEFTHDLDDYLTATGIVDADGDPSDIMLGSGTLTVEFAPVTNLIIKLDVRYDGSNEDVFPRRITGTSPHQATATLGVVAKSF